MTNQEQYELICEKAEKYDEFMGVLDEIKDELEEMRPTVRHTDEYWQGVSYGICYVLDNAIKIIDRHKAESEE